MPKGLKLKTLHAAVAELKHSVGLEDAAAAEAALLATAESHGTPCSVLLALLFQFAYSSV